MEKRNIRSTDLAKTQSHRNSTCISRAHPNEHGEGLLAHLLFLQGDRRAQHHQALHGHLFSLLHQQDQGLLGDQQGPENQHSRETD